jgi:hypothetical protein
MPAAIFEPNNRVALSTYIAETERFYEYGSGDGAIRTTLGTCASQGFYERGAQSVAPWPLPTQVMNSVCIAQCGCVFATYPHNIFPLCNQTAPSSTTTFCSLCTTADNVPRAVQFFYQDAGDLDASN